MRKTALSIVGALGLIAALSLATPSQDPEGMTCRSTTVVTYHAGPHWDEFGKYVGEHLAFLRRGMERGEILYAGPFVTENGGVTIFSLTDLAAVDALVSQDTLVTNKVVTYTLKGWRMCSHAKP